jgi:hypothetical protein
MSVLLTNTSDLNDVAEGHRILGNILQERRGQEPALISELVNRVWDRAVQSRPLLKAMAERFEANERFTLERLADRSQFSYEEIRNLMYRSLGRSMAKAKKEIGGRHQSPVPELLEKKWNGSEYEYWMTTDVHSEVLAR